MEVTHTYQASFEEISGEKIDFFLASSGFQKRCTYLAENLINSEAEKVFIVNDDKYLESQRIENEQRLISLGFESYNALANSQDHIFQIMSKLCMNRMCNQINILVDYSCMSKIWCSAIINYLMSNEFNSSRINVYFAFTPKEMPNVDSFTDFQYFGPIENVKKKSESEKPVVFIAGLNNSVETIIQASDSIKPDEIFAFVPKYSFSEQYCSDTMETNRKFLDRVPERNIIKYPAHRPEQINTMLTSLCMDRRLDSELIVLPLGPKTFALASLLLNVQYPDIKIWDLIPNRKKKTEEQGNAIGKPIITKVVFVSDDNEEDD